MAELDQWINSAGEGGGRNSMQYLLSSGTQTSFEFNFAGGYIDPANVKAYIYHTASGLTDPVDPVVLTGPNTIEVIPSPPAGDYLVVYRDTQKTVPLVDFATSAILNEDNLDKIAKQAVFIAAEMVDRFSEIKTSSDDAIVRSFTALTASNKAIADSAAAVLASGTAVSTANSAASAAGNAVTTANNAESVANGIDAKATQAMADGAAAVVTANAAEATANGIDAKAQQALDNSETAVNTAGSAEDAAGVAVTTANAASTAVANKVDKSGGTMTGPLIIPAATQPTHAMQLGQTGRVLLGTQAASNSSHVELVWADTAFDHYEVMWDRVVPVTDAAVLVMKYSSNSGSSYPASTFYLSVSGVAHDGTVTNGGTTVDAGIRIGGSPDVGLAAGSPQGTSGRLLDFNRKFQNTTFEQSANLGSKSWRLTGACYGPVLASPANAIHFSMNAGNIASGSFRVYGVR